nr:tripartite tricarboxylate transporter substrate binding protein [Variovorax sp. dw_954]
MKFNPLLLLVVTAVFALPLQALAADEPAATRIVVGYPAGGGADGLARAYAQAMSKSLERPVIVENKPGAGGTMAAVAVKGAPADGSVLLLGNIVVNVLSEFTYNKLPYDPKADFVAVGQAARLEIALAVPPDSAARTVADYLAAAKADPQHAAFFASPAAGSLPHFFGLLLGKAAGVELSHVPYKGGAPMNLDLMAGRVPAAFSAASEFVQLHKAGRVRMLATSGDRRSEQTPDVPTFAEAGFPTVHGSSWLALFAPARTRPETLARLEAAMQAASADPEVRKAIDALGMEYPNMTREQFSKQLPEERQRWGAIVRASGFKAD